MLILISVRYGSDPLTFPTRSDVHCGQTPARPAVKGNG